MSNSCNQFRSVAPDPTKRSKRFAGIAGWNDEPLPSMDYAEIATLHDGVGNRSHRIGVLRNRNGLGNRP